ncbi:hypothetical protein DRO97_10640 [Archaeoglobales archaeon]|nr:MAG: hypothetical protein DRO97_10640 [Archaeoglobales archaeon]
MVIIPDVRINRNVSKIDNKPPGRYEYTQNTTIDGFIRIVNRGDRGRCRALVYDETNKRELFSRYWDLDQGQAASAGFRITVDRDMKVTIYGQYYDFFSSTWRTQDIYGSWEILVEEVELPPPEEEIPIPELPPEVRAQLVTLSVVLIDPPTVRSVYAAIKKESGEVIVSNVLKKKGDSVAINVYERQKYLIFAKKNSSNTWQTNRNRS